MKSSLKNMLIVRFDNIGDLIVSLPTCTLVKKHLPNTKLTVISKAYTRGVAKLCDSIDEFIPIEELDIIRDPIGAKQKLKDKNIDSCINLLAHVKDRGNLELEATKTLFGVTLADNLKLNLKRRGSYGLFLLSTRLKNIFSKNESLDYIYTKEGKTMSRHEIYKNMYELKNLGITKLPSIEELPKLYNLNPNKLQLNKDLKHAISPDKFNLILHPKSNGNCIEWPISNYIQLINLLNTTKFRIILTGSSKEKQYTQEILQNIDKNKDAIDLAGQTSPEDLPALIYQADGLVAGSTGPMHIAAALGVNTLGIFPCRPKSKMYKQWFPIGYKAYSIASANMTKLSPERVLETITQKFLGK